MAYPDQLGKNASDIISYDGYIPSHKLNVENSSCTALNSWNVFQHCRLNLKRRLELHRAKQTSIAIDRRLQGDKASGCSNVMALTISSESALWRSFYHVVDAAGSRQDVVTKYDLEAAICGRLKRILGSFFNEVSDFECSEEDVSLMRQTLSSVLDLTDIEETSDLVDELVHREGFRNFCYESDQDSSLGDAMMDLKRVVLSPNYTVTDFDRAFVYEEKSYVTEQVHKMLCLFSESTSTTFLGPGVLYGWNKIGKYIRGLGGDSLIIGLVSLGWYNQRLRFNPGSLTVMDEALIQWESICQSTWYQGSSYVLCFLGVNDLRFMMATSPLSLMFPEYQGGETVDAAAEFIKGKFLRRGGKPTDCFVGDLNDSRLIPFLIGKSKMMVERRREGNDVMQRGEQKKPSIFGMIRP